MNEEKKKEITQLAWKVLPLKVKLIIIGSGLSFFLMLIFLVVIITPLTELGIIEGTGSSSSPYFDYMPIISVSGFWWPVASDNTVITSTFGGRSDPFSKQNAYHGGVDIAPSGGEPAGTVDVIASKSGIVTYPSRNDKTDCPSLSTLDSCGGGYGNYVVIQHDDGTSTLYGHMYEKSIMVEAGDKVSAGQVLGKIGSSGRSTGPHLHFEIRINGNKVDPLDYVSKEMPTPLDSDEDEVEEI